ncbi:MAG: hypothetical protein PW843_26445 [Azospirillaceae bacterium]|nr:hypothetical protein [Azospirillaceae bacterium]
MSTTSNAVPVIFDNQSGGEVWIQFLNGVFGTGQTGAGGTVALSGDTAYSLSDLTGPVPGLPGLGNVPNVALSDFTNGRLYLNVGSAGLQNLGNGYQPASATVTDPNYHTPYAYIELNVFGNPANNMDLSDIDFFSMALEASTWLNGQQVAAMTFVNSDPTALGQGVETLATLSGGQAVVGQITRVNGPGLAPGYHDWTDYFTYLAGLPAPVATIAGTYAGQGAGSGSTTTEQTYSLTATFDQAAQTVTLSGSASVVGATTIVLTYAALNLPTGVYGANPSYSVNGGAQTGGIVNDVYGWVVADLLAGLNYGFLGSTTPVNSQPLGAYTSSQWLQLAADTPSIRFGGAQSNSAYYNGYAAQIAKMTEDAYGFPFSDRVQQLLLYFPPAGQTNGVDYLKITILPINYPL